MSFKFEITARFHEVDRAGIVFYGRVFEYSHICFEEMMTAAFGDFDHVFDDVGVGLPLVHAEASFQRPIRRGDRLIAELSVAKLSERSITFQCRLIGSDDQVERCRVFQKHAFVQFPDFAPTVRPAAFITGLEKVGLVIPE